MKEIGKLLLYLVATVIVGALLAPPLFYLGHWVADHGILTFLGETPLQRYFARGVLIAAVALLWPLVKSFGGQGIGRPTLQRDPRGWQNLGFGLAASVLLMAALGTILIASHVYKFRNEIEYSRLIKVVFSAAGAGIAEEFLFRGAILAIALKAWRKWGALIFTSALYSIVHFLKSPPDSVPDGSVTWLAGFRLIPNAFWQFSDPLLLTGGFTTLFLLGMILGYAALRTHSLWLPIGLHAGMILGKFGFTKLAKQRNDPGIWFGQDLAVGLGPLILLGILWALVWWWLRYADSRHAQSSR